MPMLRKVPGMTGMTEESATRRPRTPNTRSDESTTAPLPMRAAIFAVPVSALPAPVKASWNLGEAAQKS